MLKTMHLFAGIGGGLLADRILGHDPIIAVEWEPYACQVLRERAADGWFPSLQVWEGDVRLFDPSEYAGRVDCIHAGFPCQDISRAGKQAGLGEGTRSGLYREVLRIAGVVRPKYLFLENVSAIITNGLGDVLGDLASMGYDTRWCCLKASDVGANHHRDRWWLLANSNSNSKSTLSIDDETSRMQKFSKCNATNSNCAQLEGGRIPFRIQQKHSDTGGGTWWSNKPAIPGVDDGTPNRLHRLKGGGNGQVPLQAAAAWKLLGGE